MEDAAKAAGPEICRVDAHAVYVATSTAEVAHEPQPSKDRKVQWSETRKNEALEAE